MTGWPLTYVYNRRDYLSIDYRRPASLQNTPHHGKPPPSPSSRSPLIAAAAPDPLARGDCPHHCAARDDGGGLCGGDPQHDPRRRPPARPRHARTQQPAGGRGGVRPVPRPQRPHSRRHGFQVRPLSFPASRSLTRTLSHGDLLFLSYKPRGADPDSHPAMEASAPHPQPSQPDPSHPKTHTDPPLPNTIPLKDLSSVQEPEIDQYWEKQTGKIERKRDPAFCRHGEKAMCDYCMPLEVCRRPLLGLCRC